MVKFIRKGLGVKYFSDKAAEVTRVENCLKFKVDGGEYSPSYQEGKWDGYHRFYNKRFRSFDYGLLHLVQHELDKRSIKYSIENDFKPLKMRIGARVDPTMTGQWEHQNRGIISFLKTPHGTAEIPTRGGKTKMTAEIMRLVDFEQILFIVDDQMLFQQAIGDISKHLGLNRKQIGQIQGDVFELKPITVAMIQTLQSIRFGVTRLKNKNKKKAIEPEAFKQQRKERRVRNTMLENFLKGVKFLVVDEVHEYSSDQRAKVVRVCSNVDAVLCLSATPEKSESPMDNIHIKAIGGKLFFKVSESELKAKGVLAHEDITLIELDHRKNRNIILREDNPYSKFEDEIIINNERRNGILINVIQICRHLGFKVLVLFNRVKHAQHIQKITGDELLTGETKVEQRINVKNQFLRRKGGVLLATNIFKKGITLPEVEIMVNAGGGLEQTKIIQKKGRTLGTTAAKKKAMTIDMLDVSDYFSEHSLSRIAVYEERVGIENIAIFSSTDADFYEDIREHLINWKNNE